MGDVRGSNVLMQIVPESAYKTPGATGEQLSVVTCGVVPQQPRVQSQTLSGKRGQARSVTGAKNVAGPINVEMAPEDIGIYLKHLIGAPTTAGANPYTHTFTPAASGANALPVGFTLQYDYGSAIASASRFLRLNGCRIGQGVFNFTPNGTQTLQLDVMGADFSQSNTDLDATPVVLGHTNWESTQLSVVLGGGSPKDVCFASLGLTVSNDLDAEKYCISGAGVRDGLPEGFCIVTGQGVMFFDDEDVIDTLLSGTDTELAITLTRGDGLGSAGNESMVITVGDLVFEKTAPPVDGPRGLKVSVSFTAHRIGTSEIDLSVVLKNAVATIT